MADYRLSNKADEDLTDIYLYTHKTFGAAQADAYLQALEERFVALAEKPTLGRRIDHVRDGYLRFEHGRHAIFYRTAKYGVLIVRVLHARMDVQRHL